MSQWYHFPFGLRFKLVMLSVFLFAIPWLGYEFVWEMEKYLRQGQEKTLLGTTRAVPVARAQISSSDMPVPVKSTQAR